MYTAVVSLLVASGLTLGPTNCDSQAAEAYVHQAVSAAWFGGYGDGPGEGTSAGSDDTGHDVGASEGDDGRSASRPKPPQGGGGSQRNIGSKDPAVSCVGGGTSFASDGPDLAGSSGPDCVAPAPGEGGGPSAVTLSQQARERLPVPAPLVRTAPPRGKKVLVHMPTWLWLDESQWGARSKTARAGDVWAKVTADARQLVIDPGDGSDLVYCEAPGLPYGEGAEVKDACTVTYDHSGTYTVRVTANWGADWAGSDGNGGELPTIGRTASFQVTVVEARSELIDGG